MTTSLTSPILQKNVFLAGKEQATASECLLYWRQKQLLVLRSFKGLPGEQPQSLFALMSDRQWLAECLRKSPVRLVRFDAALGETELKAWAEACEKAGKTLYLRLPTAAQFPHRQTSFWWWWKRVLDWSLAFLLSVLLSPLMLTIAVLIRLSTPGPILFQQWRVGARGKLFKVLKFRTMVVEAEDYHHQVMANQSQGHLHKREDDPRITPLGKWLRKSSLDELPQLINVLRGEMSLVGPRPWALYDAVRVRSDLQSRLNALPGMTGAWQVEARFASRSSEGSTLLDIDKVNDRDLEYLRNWSLTGDLKILLRTVPKVLSGFGAC